MRTVGNLTTASGRTKTSPTPIMVALTVARIDHLNLNEAGAVFGVVVEGGMRGSPVLILRRVATKALLHSQDFLHSIPIIL